MENLRWQSISELPRPLLGSGRVISIQGLDCGYYLGKFSLFQRAAGLVELGENWKAASIACYQIARAQDQS